MSGDFLADLKIERAVSADLREQVARLARECDEAQTGWRESMARFDELHAVLKDAKNLAGQNAEWAEEARARALKAEAERDELLAALRAWQSLNVECFNDGWPAPCEGCVCNTCETWREGSRAIAKVEGSR